MGTSFGNLCLATLGAIGVHVVYLILNHSLGKYVVRLQRPDYKACLICGSQKTLPVAVTVISYFPKDLASIAVFGDPALMAVPCIVGHLSQLFIDSFLVLRMNSYDEKVAAKNAELGIVDSMVRLLGLGYTHTQVRKARYCAHM